MSTGTTPVGAQPSHPGLPEGGHDWEAISRMPEYRRLVARRRRLVTLLSAVSLGTLAIFTALVCYARDAMATEIVGGISVGYALGVAEMLLTAALGAVYVRVARREYGPLEREVVNAVAREEATR